MWQAGATGPTGPRNAAPAMSIGSLQTAANFFSGMIDDVCIYGSALTGAQVAALAMLMPLNTAPTLAAMADHTIIAGQSLNVTTSASVTDAPPQTLTFSLVTAPTNSALSSASGFFTWRPAIA